MRCGLNRFSCWMAMALMWVVASAVAQTDLTWDRSADATQISASAGGRAVAVYQASSSPYKPYVQQLFTPDGVQVLRDHVPDHPHHHGLMFAVAVDGVDFWEETDKSGKQTVAATQVDGGQLAQSLNWCDPAGKVLATEQRHINVRQADSATLLTWRTTLAPAVHHDQITLGGSHYFGLGMRFVESMDRVSQFINAAGAPGEVVRGEEKLTRANWIACVGPVDGKTVTVAMFDAASNPCHPSWWFTMPAPFAYQSATLNLWRQPMVLKQGQTLGLIYGVALLDGVADANRINAVYEQWQQQTAGAADTWTTDQVNVALPKYGTTATSSSDYGPDYAASKAIDGKWAVRETDKWNSGEYFTPHYLTLDLGQARTIDRIRIYHEGVVAGGEPFNTLDFRLLRSDRPGGPWVDLVPPVRGNHESVTHHEFKPVKTRYVRLLIDTGQQDGTDPYGRIFEIQVFSPKADVAENDR